MERTVASLLEAKGREVFSIGPEATVYAALEMMAQRKVENLTTDLQALENRPSPSIPGGRTRRPRIS